MRDLLRAFVLMILAAIALAIVAPGVLIGVRLADSWTSQNTNQLLGGGLAICGGGAAIVAVLIGAGLFATLAGWRPPRREDRMPPDIEAPYPQSTPAQAPHALGRDRRW